MDLSLFLFFPRKLQHSLLCLESALGSAPLHSSSPASSPLPSSSPLLPLIVTCTTQTLDSNLSTANNAGRHTHTPTPTIRSMFKCSIDAQQMSLNSHVQTHK